MSRISRVRGKHAELSVARFIGARRNHFEAEDLAHPVLSIEVKHRKAMPIQLAKWMEQAEQAASESKTPCLVLHEHGQEYGDSFAVIRLSRLKDLIDG